jgi:hypothetical protein
MDTLLTESMMLFFSFFRCFFWEASQDLRGISAKTVRSWSVNRISRRASVYAAQGFTTVAEMSLKYATLRVAKLARFAKTMPAIMVSRSSPTRPFLCRKPGRLRGKSSRLLIEGHDPMIDPNEQPFKILRQKGPLPSGGHDLQSGLDFKDANRTRPHGTLRLAVHPR